MPTFYPPGLFKLHRLEKYP